MQARRRGSEWDLRLTQAEASSLFRFLVGTGTPADEKVAKALVSAFIIGYDEVDPAARGAVVEALKEASDVQVTVEPVDPDR